MKRRARFSYTDDSPTTSKAICSSCYENNITSFTVPYIMKDGRPDKGFRQCPNCNDIIPVKLTRHNSETQPLGWKGGLGPVVFGALERSKRSRIRVNKDSEDVFNVEDYPFPGKEDSDLRQFVNQGFIVAINDFGNDDVD